MTIRAADLCQGDGEKEIKIDFYESSTDGKHVLLASKGELTLNNIKAANNPSFEF